MAAALRARDGDCLLHGRHHELGPHCQASILNWYACAYPDARLGWDLAVITQTSSYQAAYEQALAEAAQRVGHCPTCARLGQACAACAPGHPQGRAS